MKFLLGVATFALVASTPSTAQTLNAFRAGAAKVDITPAASDLLPGDTIRDSLNVRAVVIGNGQTCAVLVGIDLIAIPQATADDAIARAAKASGCPASNFIVSATHTHSASSRHFMDPSGQPSAQRVADAVVQSVVAAVKVTRPAKIGFGTTKLDSNINRDLFAAGQWLQGPNPNGPSDKTLAVLQIVDERDMPIAVYMNYAMHPIHFFLSGVVSADVPGAAAEYVERRFGQNTVAIFAQGAAGDQNPNLLDPAFNLIRVRAGLENASDMRVTRPGNWIEAAGDKNMNIRLFAGTSKPVPPENMGAYRDAIASNDALVTAKGAIMGETVIETMRFGTPSFATSGQILGALDSFQCPGRDRLDRDDPVREGSLPPYADGAAVRIGAGMLRIGDAYIASVNGEVYNEIATRLKAASPVSNLMMTTLANGLSNSGYIYSDAASSHLTFQVISSRLKPGCAEDKIVATGLALIDKVRGK